MKIGLEKSDGHQFYSDKISDNTNKLWSFGYDAGDRLTTTTEQVSPTYGDFTISRSYDPVGNLTNIKPSGDSTGLADTSFIKGVT